MTRAADAGAALPTADSDALAREGRALYRGERPWREPPTLHGLAMAGAACVQCHGMRGDARSEGGVAVPAIRWQRLLQADAQRPAYADEAQVLRALREGHSPAGRPLAAPMPRYAIADDEARALLAWLRAMGTDAAPAPGVSAERIVLGSVLPASGPQAAAGAAVRAALERGVAAINRDGGVFGRRLALEIADAGPDAASASAAAARMVAGGRVFVLVAALLPEPDAALRQALARHDSALVASLGQPTAPATDARITWMLPGIDRQLAQLAAALPRHCPAARDGLRVIAWRQGALNALEAPAPDAAGTPVQWMPVDGETALQAALAAASRPTIALLPAALTQRARDTLGRQGQCLGTLAVVSGAPPPTSATPELVGLPMPALATAGAGAGLWTALADGALATVAEALARTGRQLDTGAFLKALDSVDRLQTAGGLHLGFGPRRRHGLEPAWIWKEGPSHDTPPTPPPAPARP